MTYIFLARGFEEIEALTAVDMMRRAGIQIRTVSLMKSKKVSKIAGSPLCTKCPLITAMT